MSVHWPTKLNFKFLCENKVIPNLLILPVLLSKVKNNFSIGPLITNKDGEICIKHKALSEIIENSKIDYPMDYYGTLDDCTGLEIVVETIEELMIRVNNLKEFYPQKAKELQKLIQKCTNKEYFGEHMLYNKPFNFELVEVTVRKK